MPRGFMKCGCWWDGHVLARCERHREAGSLAADLAPERDQVKTVLLVKASNLRATADAPAWMFENAFRHALGRTYTIVHSTVDALLRAWEKLPGSMRMRICDDIHAAIREGRAGTTYCVAQWERILAWEEGTR